MTLAGGAGAPEAVGLQLPARWGALPGGPGSRRRWTPGIAQLGCRCVHMAPQPQPGATATAEGDDVGPQNPFSLVSEELDSVSTRMRSAVASEARRQSPGDMHLWL